MATFNKFQGFVGYLGVGAVNLNTDTLKVYLSNATPSASLDDIKTDLAEISMTNEINHGAGGADTANTYAEASGTGTCTATDVTFLASGGTVGPFQYVVLYDDTHASDILIGWWDYGSAVTLNSGESFTVDFTTSSFTIA